MREMRRSSAFGWKSALELYRKHFPDKTFNVALIAGGSLPPINEDGTPVADGTAPAAVTRMVGDLVAAAAQALPGKLVIQQNGLVADAPPPALVTTLGLAGSLGLLVPGLLVAGLLMTVLPGLSRPLPALTNRATLAPQTMVGAMLLLILVIAVRSWTQIGFSTYVPFGTLERNLRWLFDPSLQLSPPSTPW